MLVLTNARVFDGRSVLPGRHSIGIEGSRIRTIEPGSIATSAADTVVDLGGLMLLPGLITSHLHPDFYKFDITAGERQGKERPPGVLMAIGVRTCRTLLDSGFTGYVGASCAHDIDVQLKMAIAEGIVPGPRIRPCGHHIGTTGDVLNGGLWWKRYETPGTDIWDDGPVALRKLVREEISRGVEIVKIFAGTGHGIPGRSTRNMATDEIAAVVEAAHDRGAKVRAHVAAKEMVLECVRLGVDVIDHGDGIDDECIDAMAAAGTFWVPSLTYLRCLIELNMGTRLGITQELYEHVRQTLPKAHRAGVRVLLGDDYSGVFRNHLADDPLDHEVGNYARELAFYGAVDGLSPEDVMRWATSNPGELLVDAPSRIGVIEPGAIADVIIVDGDPLADLSLLTRPDQTLKAVVRDGRLVIDRLTSSAGRTAGELVPSGVLT